MPKSKEVIKEESIRWVKSRISGILEAFNDPVRGMNGEEKQIYELMQEWGISIDKLSAEQREILEVCLSIEKFNKLSSQEKKPKLSKWEVVTGQRLKRD